MPEEMRWLGDDLVQRGYTVLGIRLAGHATHPRDLGRTRWQDWLINVEDGLALLNNVVDDIVVIGLSLGGNITLTAAGCYPIRAAVAMSTPYHRFSKASIVGFHVMRWIRPIVRKKLDEQHTEYPSRREIHYPAYPEFPTRILFEIPKLQDEMTNTLPKVQVPVLLVHSRDDASVPEESMQRIYNRLGTSNKQMLSLDGFDHAIVRDPKRQLIFDAIAEFIDQVCAEKESRDV
jgi:carboxylesterase